MSRGGHACRDDPAASVARALSDAEFARYQALVHRESGIWLSAVKKALLVGRLAKRLRALGLSSYGQYYERVCRDEAERISMLDCVTTNETHFFREPRHFELLAERVFPAWRGEAEAGRRPRRLRIWSAACSTGEEPYSLAMSALTAFPPGSGWEIEILATDLSTRVLDRARSAIWPLAKAAEIPRRHLERFMLRGVGDQEGIMKAGPELRAAVRFSRLNLNDQTYPIVGGFDLVFCRNVLIYFDAETKVRVIDRLLAHLAPAGLLFLGHAESLSGFRRRVLGVAPSVYALEHEAGPGGRGEGRRPAA